MALRNEHAEIKYVFKNVKDALKHLKKA